MTILKTIDGDEIDTEKIAKGYGSFTKYVQENYDKNWGKGTDKKGKFVVEFKATKTVEVYKYITVEAPTERQAEEKAREEVKKMCDWDWEENDCRVDIDDIEVESVEEAEEEEE